MTRRIMVMPPQTSGEEVFDSWLPGRGLLQESIALAGIVFVAGEIMLLGAAYLVLPLTDAVLVALAAAPVVAAFAALVALVLALYRVLRFERRERRYMWFLDHQLRRMVEGEEPMDTTSSLKAGRYDEKYWDRLAYEVLRRYYTVLERTGDPAQAVQAISRRACVQDGLCTQADWNELNRLLKARGIRGKRFLRPKTFDEAWAIWQERSAQVNGWYVRQDGTWVPKE